MAGIKERLIQVILRGKDLLSPEANKSKKALDELRESGEQLRAELDKAKDDNNLVRSLSTLEKESERAQKTADRTAAKVEQLRDELDKSPDSKGLLTSLKSAESEAAKAQKALDKLKIEAADYAAKAKAAGIDTSKLSDEEKRLAAELDTAKKAVADNTKATKDLQKEQAAAARSAAEQADKNTRLREVIGTVERRVLTYAAAYISLKAAMSAVRGVTDFVIGGFKSVFAGASESEQVLAQLNAALHSTENAAGLTADELQRMGLEMRKSSMLTTEQITEMQVALLTYTDIAKEEFPRALQIAIDQQQRLGMSVTQSAELVGMALQSPSKAMTALGRQGFVLEESQKKLLKQFEDTGQMAKAQAIIMDMLAESYGGSAAAARYSTFEGLWKGITDTFSDFKDKIASSGSFDYLKTKLEEVGTTLENWSQDGTLDNLAEAISEAFVEGAKKVEEFARSLTKVDFKQLINDSAEWLSDFGTKVDNAVEMGKTAGNIFTGVWHGFRALVTGAATVLAGVVNQTLGNLLRAAAAVTDALGLETATEKMRFATGLMQEMQDAFADATVESWDKVTSAIEGSSTAAIEAKESESAAFEAAEKAKQAAIDKTIELNERFKKQQEDAAEAHRLAAVEGTRAIEDMAEALQLIDSTESVTELEKLRTALLKAYQDGTLSMEEYQQATGVVSGKIKTVGDAAKAAGKDLKTLNGVMEAIGKAANDIDIRQAKAALDKLYREGKISAEEHAKAQDKLNKKIAELKPAAEKAKKSAEDMNAALDDTGEGLGVVDNRAAAAAASIAWFQGHIEAARAPLEEMSEAARDAFNELQGVHVEPTIDISSVEATEEALLKARDEAIGLTMSLNQLSSANISDSLSRWAYMTKQRAKQVEVGFLEQKLELQKLQESYEKGTLSAQKFVAAASTARAKFNLLDDADLSALEGAVDAAKQKMDQLANSTKGTLESLNDELLQLKGTQEEIEKSKMDSRRRDLQAQLADARKDGDNRAVANLQKALSTLSEIESERERAARNKKAEEAKAEAEKAAAKPATTQKQEPTKIIKLQVGGQSVNVGVESSRDETALLDILAQAGLRSM